MLLIQPEDRPTAAAALSHEWLAGIHSDNEDGCEDQDKATQIRNESTRSCKRKNSLATHGRPKKRRSKRNQITLGDIRSIPGGVAFGAGTGSQSSSNFSGQKTVIDTSVMTLSRADAASTESSRAETGPRISELMPHNSQATDPKSRNALREKNTRCTPQTYLQGSSPNTRLNLLTKPIADENWMLNSRPPSSGPPTPNPYRGNSLQSTRETNGQMENTRKKMDKAPAFAPASTRDRTIS